MKNLSRGVRGFRPSLHAELTSLIRDMIVRHELKSGEWIPEAELCARLGVSRTPMREALKVLAAETLVDLHPNRGATVAALIRGDVDRLLEAQSIIEGAAASLACERASAEAIRDFEAIHKKMVAAYEKLERRTYFTLNQNLHRALVAMSDNKALVAAHSNIFNHVERARFLALDVAQRWKESVDQHEQILDALIARDGARARRQVEAHIDETRDALLRVVEQDNQTLAAPERQRQRRNPRSDR